MPKTGNNTIGKQSVKIKGERANVGNLMELLMPMIDAKFANYMVCSKDTQDRLSKRLCHFYLGTSENPTLEIFVTIKNVEGKGVYAYNILKVEIKAKEIDYYLHVSIPSVKSKLSDIRISPVNVVESSVKHPITSLSIPILLKNLSSLPINQKVSLL